MFCSFLFIILYNFIFIYYNTLSHTHNPEPGVCSPAVSQAVVYLSRALETHTEGSCLVAPFVKFTPPAVSLSSSLRHEGYGEAEDITLTARSFTHIPESIHNLLFLHPTALPFLWTVRRSKSCSLPSFFK